MFHIKDPFHARLSSDQLLCFNPSCCCARRSRHTAAAPGCLLQMILVTKQKSFYVAVRHCCSFPQQCIFAALDDASAKYNCTLHPVSTCGDRCATRCWATRRSTKTHAAVAPRPCAISPPSSRYVTALNGSCRARDATQMSCAAVGCVQTTGGCKQHTNQRSISQCNRLETKCVHVLHRT